MHTTPVVARLLLAASLVAGGSTLGSLPAATPETPAEKSLQEELTPIRDLLRKGRYADVERRSRALLPEVEARYGEESVEVAAVLDELVDALWRFEQGAPDVLQLAERAVEIKRRAYGADHPELRRSLSNLGYVLAAEGRKPESAEQYRRVIEISETHPEAPEIPIWHQPGYLRLIMLSREGRDGEVESGARDLFEKLQADYGENSVEAGAVLDVLVRALVGQDKPLEPELRSLAERAVELNRRLYGSRHAQVAASLSSLGLALLQGGLHEEAEEQLLRVLAICEEFYGPEHRRVAMTLDNLGAAYWWQTKYDRARATLERALAIREKLLGPDHPDLIPGLGNLALLHETLGDYPASKSVNERILAIAEKANGPEHPLVAHILNNFASTVYQMGDYLEARAMLERAVSIGEVALQDSHPVMVAILSNFARVRNALHDYQGARSLYERLVPILEETEGTQQARTMQALMSLARLMDQLGELEKAKALYEKSAAYWEESFGPDHPHLAISLSGLAHVYADAGEPARARPIYERALAMFEKMFGSDHPRTFSTLGELAVARWLEGETDGAFETALEAESRARRHFRENALGLPQQEALQFNAARTSGLDVALSAVVGADESTLARNRNVRIWDELVRSRAMVIDEMATRHRSVVDSADPKTAALARELTLASNRLAAKFVQGPNPAQPENYRAELEQALREKRDIERRLAERSRLFRRFQSTRQVGLADVRAALPDGSALVAYVRYDRLARPPAAASPAPPTGGDPDRSTQEGESYYLALIAQAGEDDIQSVDLGPAATIDGMVVAWSESAATDPRSHPRNSAKAEQSYREAGRKLKARIWDPIAARIPNAKLVFLVPDGSLHRTSLATLPDGDRYLVETGPLLHYLSAERDLVRLRGRKSHVDTLLVLGGADFDAAAAERSPKDKITAVDTAATNADAMVYRGPRSECGGFRSLRFAPLPGTLAEAEEIRGLWMGKNATESAAGTPAKVVMLTGAAADERRFKDLAGKKSVLHLATHGFSLLEDCEAGPGFAGGERGQGGAGAPPAAEVPDNPLLLTGLALSGANRRNKIALEEGVEDGILTAEEIAALDLTGVDWAVLSACGTATGPVFEGEGVLGLRRAFEIAGAGTLIMSLWSVEDDATRAWMRDLYDARLGGLSTAEAVRQASLDWIAHQRDLEKSTHPFFWGAFVAAGDWR